MDPQSPPTFFKVVIDPSAPQLPLPADFVTFHLKEKIPKNPIIQCANRGYSWKLKIEKVNEFYCFTHGWKDVVKDVNLGFGDFLVFSQIDESIFTVLIFSPNGCQKDLPNNVKVQEADGTGDDLDIDVDDDVDNDDADVHNDDDDVDNDDDDVGDDDEEGDAFLMVTMAKTNRSVLRLTKEFVRLSGINGGGSIQIKNLDGEEFPIAMRTNEPRPNKKYYYLSTGWLDFRRVNNLLDGDKYIVKFLKNEGKLCLAKIPDSPEHKDDVDEEVEDENANVIKRPRGRPRKR